MQQLVLDSGELVVDSVTQNDKRPSASSRPMERWPSATGGDGRPTKQRTRALSNRAAWVRRRACWVYVFSTSQWMPSRWMRRTSALRCSWRCAFLATCASTAVGDELPSRLLGDGRIEHRWLRKPTPALSSYSFAAGPYRHARQGRLQFYSKDRSRSNCARYSPPPTTCSTSSPHAQAWPMKATIDRRWSPTPSARKWPVCPVMSEAYGKGVLDDPSQTSDRPRSRASMGGACA